MYFPHSYHAVFISTSSSALTLPATGTTATIAAGNLGLFDKNWTVIDTTVTPSAPPQFYLVQGSFHTVDKLGAHGGYKESVKSKLIDPRNITRFFKVSAVNAVNQVISVGWDQTVSGATSNVGPVFDCGKTYYLRLDIKGSPALRFLNHNIYKDVWYYTGCCANDCSSGCTNDPVDATTVMLGWKDFINQDPYLSQFVRPQVYWNNSGTKTEAFSVYDKTLNSALTIYTPNTTTPASVVACLQLTAAYADTSFGNCTWSPSDFYELEPLTILASLRDESGEPCAIRPTINTSTSTFVKEITAAVQASGVGETVIRKYVLSNRYRQEPFPDGNNVDQLRLREVLDDTSFTAVSRTTKYDAVCILHHVNNHSNPGSGNDNPRQYLEVVYVPTGANTTQLTNWVSAQLTAIKSEVALETF